MFLLCPLLFQTINLNIMGSKYFLTARNGTFAERPDNGVYKTFNEITGHIVHVSFKFHSSGDLLRVHIVDEENFYVLSMFANSRTATGFFMSIENVDLSEKVRISIKSAGVGTEILNIHQNNVAVKWYYTGDKQSILPRNYVERLDYLKKMIETVIIPRLKRKLNPYPFHAFYQHQFPGAQAGYFSNHDYHSPKFKPMSDNEKNYNDGN